MKKLAIDGRAMHTASFNGPSSYTNQVTCHFRGGKRADFLGSIPLGLDVDVHGMFVQSLWAETV